MNNDKYNDYVKNDRVEIDPDHDFMPVICENMKKNGRICGTYLGEIETSRPNISKHRCRECKIVYRHDVDEIGVVSWDITEKVIATTKTIAKVKKC